MAAGGTVYVFWDQDNDMEETVDRYATCVREAPKSPGCIVRCRVIETHDVDASGFRFWSKRRTIEVAAVKNGEVVERLDNPSVQCTAIRNLVAELCD